MEQKSKPSPKIIIETMLATGMTQAEAADHFGVSTRWIRTLQARYGPDPRKVDTSGVSYAALVSVAEFSASKTSGAERLHQECRRRV
ncbi:helix-turn-helix domain-containing protein, partial [Corynebacterium tuberculostearicum]